MLNREKRIEILSPLIENNIDSRLSDILANKANNSWQRIIEPLISECWPELKREEFYSKFKMGSELVYAWGGYIMLILRKNKVRLPDKIIPSLIDNFFSAFVSEEQDRKIILTSAFNTLIDEILDNRLKNAEELISCFEKTPTKPYLKLLLLITKELEAPLPDLRKTIKAWVDLE